MSGVCKDTAAGRTWRQHRRLEVYDIGRNPLTDVVSLANDNRSIGRIREDNSQNFKSPDRGFSFKSFIL
jgi:hypothetical protein